jgi:hypothetical protein
MKTRKKITIVLIGVLIILIINILLKYERISKITRSTNLTSIEFTSDSIIDLGNIGHNSTAPFSFFIKNNSLNKLYISDISATCGCTDVLSNNNMALAGDSIKISGTVNCQNKTGKSITQLYFKANTKKGDHTISLRYFCL